MSGMPKLRILWLSQNQLTGTVPLLTNLPELEQLFADNNQLNGQIPDMSGLPKLKRLILACNQLSGPIPESLGTVSSLEFLILLDNDLNGEIPDLTQLTSLQRLLINHNFLEGDFSSTDALITLLPQVTQLFVTLNGNAFSGVDPLTGQVSDLPSWVVATKLASCTPRISFTSRTYNGAEGDMVDVVVALGVKQEDAITIPILATNQDGASDSDYSVPETVTFDIGETEKTISFSIVQDTDDDDESVVLGFGDVLPEGVRTVSLVETTVFITDDDDPEVEVNFDQSAYDVAEGASLTVTVNLSADPERMVVVPLTATDQDGATSEDYAALPASLTFDSGDTSKSFTFTATDDAIDDDGESVLLEFGTLPDGVTPGTIPTSTVSITDGDAPASVAVSWAQTTYSVVEGGTVTVTAELDDNPEKTVIVPIAITNQGGASNSDYSGVPPSLTFDSGDTSKSFTFTATDDALDDDDESVQLAFGPTLPSGVTQGTPASTMVKITDDDDPQVKVSYGLAEYTAAEGGSVTVTVKLDADPERTVVIPVTHTPRAGASNADYFGVPATVTFDSGDTSKTFTFSATDDTVDDDDEEVLLGFEASLPAGVSTGTTSASTVTITDDDDPEVKVSFAQSSYTAPEGNTVSVVVQLDADPERSVTIPITSTPKDGASAADYSVPDSVTFTAGGCTRTSARTPLRSSTEAARPQFQLRVHILSRCPSFR